MDDRPILERNLDALVRHGALPLREGDLPRAKRAFLRRLAKPAPRPRAGSAAALAASLLICAAIFSAILAERREPDATPPALPARFSPQETAVVPVPPTGQDGTVTLACTVPASRSRSPFLRFSGKADLPDRLILTLAVHRLAEKALGPRLATAPVPTPGGIAEVRSGRFEYSCPWEVPGPAVVTVEVIDDFQRDDLKRKFGGRRWRFDFPGWTPELAGRLSPALKELDPLLPEMKDLISKIEAAVVTEASWKSAGGALMAQAERLSRKVEGCDAAKLYPASVELLVYTINFLKSSAPHFAWEEGKFKGPITYYTGGEKFKDFRNQAFGFDRLRAYVDEAGPLAGREMALWVVRELRRGWPCPEIVPVVKEQAAHAGLAPFAERLQAAAAEDLDGFEAEIRAGGK